jgi:hypothetical protein
MQWKSQLRNVQMTINSLHSTQLIPFAGRAIPDLKQLGFQMIVAGSDVAFLRESVINLKKTLESN